MCERDARMAQGEPIVSATGRNLEGKERHVLDFYETPGWCTRAILPYLTGEANRAPATILDAGAGTGAIMRECLTWWPRANVIGVELDAARADQNKMLLANHVHMSETIGVDTSDFLQKKYGARWDLVISNPPYAHAEAFVRHALTMGRTCAFLLRLNWLASKSRAQFHRDHPSDVFVLPKRPSFTGDRRTDATEYAWFVWGPTDVEECLNGGFRGNRWRILDVES